MFEKELEEYKNQSKWKGKIFMKDEETCFKDGAEFGYNKAMNEAKGIIKDLLHCLPKENIEGVYEVTEAAEQFMNELENGFETEKILEG